VSVRRDAVWLLALAGLTAALYARGLHGGYFGDDLMFVTWPPRLDVAAALLERNPDTGWYRPIEALVLQLVQTRAGLATWPIHAIAIALHATIAWVTLLAVRRLGGGTRAAVTAGLAVVLLQAGAMAVASNDTLSLLFGTLAGAIAAWVLLPPASPASVASPASAVASTDASAPIGWRAVLACWAAFVLALLSKETSVGWLPLLLIVLAWRGWKGSRTVPVMAGAGLVVLTACYLAGRALTGATPPSFGPSRYQMSVGLNVIENIAMLAGALLSPVPPERLFHPHAGPLARIGAAAGALVVLVLAAHALRVRALRARMAWVVAGAVLVLSPMLPLNRVSELYVYAAVPFLAVVLGFALDRVLAGRAARAWALVAVVLAGAHVMAVQHKLGMMVANGRRATALIQRLRPHVDAVATHGTLWLVSHRDPAGRYSVFRMPGFHVLDYGDGFLRAWFVRPDLRVSWRDEPGPAPVARAGDVVVRSGSPEFAGLAR
jgi:hypothetical protein